MRVVAEPGKVRDVATGRDRVVAPAIGGVAWYPSSAADKPGAFSPPNSAAVEGAAVAGGVEARPEPAAASSFAFRKAAGFMVRRGCGSDLDDWCPLPGMSSAAWTSPTGATILPAARGAIAALEGAAPAMTGARKVTPKATATDASRRIAIVRRTRPPSRRADLHGPPT